MHSSDRSDVTSELSPDYNRDAHFPCRFGSENEARMKLGFALVEMRSKDDGGSYDDRVAIICASFAKASSTLSPVFAEV